MKASSKIALWVAAGVAALACLKKKQSVSGIGAVYIPREVINKARGLFIAYDKACKIEEEHSAKVDAIFDELEAQGIDWQNTEFGKKMAADKLFRAGLSDENGETDVYVNRINARRALLNYIYSDVLPILPLKRSDIELFKNDYSILRQNKLIEIVRGLIDTSGMGKILENDYYGATVTTKDGMHAVSFRPNAGTIMVFAHYYDPDNENRGDWTYWFSIGNYQTLAGAKRGAIREMRKMGYELDEKDLAKL